MRFSSFLRAVIQSGSMDVTSAVKESATVFGFALKEKQIEAVSSFVGGHDTFVSLPTGYGKSICYAILPSVFDRIKGRCMVCSIE